MPESFALQTFETMVRIRAFEDKVHELKADDELDGFIHLVAGQEAIDAVVCGLLENDDSIFTTFRNHGQCIAKGMSTRAMMAEMFGRDSGCCRGKGGSMHLADHSKHMFGGNGIVGSSPPLALGPALAAKTLGTTQVSVAFFGEGAAQQGTTQEALNLAAIWDLPVIFVCSNNMYAQATPIDYASRVPNIAERAAAYGMPGVTVDGQNAAEVYETAHEAIARARSGGGPTLIEGKTWLYYGAWEGEHPDAKVYRSVELDNDYKRRDPIAIHSQLLLETGWATETEGRLEKVRAAAAAEIEDAVSYARASNWPDVAAGGQGVYVSY
jgi:pyruvate dehydrogenase E1 component alpha subunit